MEISRGPDAIHAGSYDVERRDAEPASPRRAQEVAIGPDRVPVSHRGDEDLAHPLCYSALLKRSPMNGRPVNESSPQRMMSPVFEAFDTRALRVRVYGLRSISRL